jgi:hypothetical protein
MSNHDLCIVDLINELMNRGFICYLEYEIPIPETAKFNNHRRRVLVVDIYAIRRKERVIIEVGTLSLNNVTQLLSENTRDQQTKGKGRFALLKKLLPKTRLIHVTQWKNFISEFDKQEEYWLQIRRQFSWNRKDCVEEMRPEYDEE